VGSRLLYEAIKSLADEKMIIGHAARRNAGVRLFMAALGAEEVEGGSIVLLRGSTDGRPWKAEFGRVSFY